MNTTTPTAADQALLKALLESPAARAALEDVDRARHATRREILAAIAAADAAAPIAALRQAHAEAVRAARAAAIALHTAECHAADVAAARDVRLSSLRTRLADLGGDVLEGARRALLTEQRCTRSLDEYRSITATDARGMQGVKTVFVDRGGAARLRQIDAALAELDSMARDAGLSPAAIEQRCSAIRASIETGAPIVRGEFAAPGDPRRMPWTARFREMRERSRARREG